MIELSYDPQTAGTKVSFIFKDGPLAMPASSSNLLDLSKRVGDSWVVPDTKETLECLKDILTHMQRQLENDA